MEEDVEEYRVEKVLNHCFVGEERLYKIKWLGYEEEEDRTWEPLDNLHVHSNPFTGESRTTDVAKRKRAEGPGRVSQEDRRRAGAAGEGEGQAFGIRGRRFASG